MRLGRAGTRVVRWDDAQARWTIDTAGAPEDVIALIERAASLAAGDPSTDSSEGIEPHGLPLHPISLRGVLNSELHWTRAARSLVREFMPRPASAGIALAERVSRRPFPALTPPPRFYETPQMYTGAHLTVIGDDVDVRFPEGCTHRDFELELGAVVTKRWRREDGTPTAADVIGAFGVVNDWSARDRQWADERRGAFSGVGKAKAFATGLGPVLVTADEILPRWDRLTGRVRVGDEVWCEGTTAGGQWSLDAIVAEAAADEGLWPGELITLGTLAGCCGLEQGRFLQPGSRVELELDGLGTLVSTVAG